MQAHVLPRLTTILSMSLQYNSLFGNLVVRVFMWTDHSPKHYMASTFTHGRGGYRIKCFAILQKVAWPSVFRLNKIHKLVGHTQSIEVLSHYLQQSKNLLLTSEWQTLQDIVFTSSNKLDVFLLHESYMVCI